ncbi:MAG: arginase [Lysobacterales bacterium]
MNDQNAPVRIIGVPMDLGASRRGTDMGPSAMRIAGLGKALRGLGREVAVEEDIPVPAMETRAPESVSARFKDEILSVCETLCSRVKRCLDEQEVPLVLGGDHSIAMGTVSGVASHFRDQKKRLGLIWFDAHGDMNTPSSSPTGNIHGMPLAHLLGTGDQDLCNIGGFGTKLDPTRVALVGIRDIDDDERRIIRESGIHAYTMRDIDEKGMARVAKEIIDVVAGDTDGFHVSFDVDGCDPSVIPGSGTLVPGGVNYREAHLLLEMCADTGGMSSMEVVELNPFLDTGNVSAERTLGMILSAFGKKIL